MLRRKAKSGIIAITQPAHSWLSGQLARAWGNDLFGAVEPAEEVVLAAGLHDLGFLAWEQVPTLNPKTGWPYTFMELPAAAHLEIWNRGIQQMLLLNRYAALLTSLHYTGLTERHPAGPPEEARQQAAFLAEQRRFQSALLAQLRKDSQYAPYTTDEAIDRNRRLIAIWDWMSLLIGFDSGESARIKDVPAHHRSLVLNMSWLRKPSPRIRISPWPFQPAPLNLHLEGRVLETKFTNETQMRQGLQTARTAALTIVLAPE